MAEAISENGAVQSQGINVIIPKYGDVRGDADTHSEFEPQGLKDPTTLGDTIDAVRAQVAAAERAAAQQAAQPDAQPAAAKVEPPQPPSYMVDREGNVLTAADSSGDFAAAPEDLNQTNGSR